MFSVHNVQQIINRLEVLCLRMIFKIQILCMIFAFKLINFYQFKNNAILLDLKSTTVNRGEIFETRPTTKQIIYMSIVIVILGVTS